VLGLAPQSVALIQLGATGFCQADKFDPPVVFMRLKGYQTIAFQWTQRVGQCRDARLAAALLQAL
jgi:hypothetical protein